MIMRVAVCAIIVGVALVKFNEIALTFESRAGGRHRCDRSFHFPLRWRWTLKADAEDRQLVTFCSRLA